MKEYNPKYNPITSAYRCRSCGKFFKVPMLRVNCCVIHSIEDCCHVGDIEIRERSLDEFLEKED